MNQPPLYSIGYATKPLTVFLDHLQRHAITAIADVRSVPYSNAFFDYHREALTATLKAAGIAYVYLGELLGPRSQVDAHYDDSGQVQFDRLSQSQAYQQGVARILKGLAGGHRIACLCAEKDPATCHRSLLIGFDLLRTKALDLQHITHAGSIESQTGLEQRLVTLHGGEDLFASGNERTELACRAQWQASAYRRPA